MRLRLGPSSGSGQGGGRSIDPDHVTGGPDQVRHIYPIVATVTDAGYERVPDDEIAAAAERTAAAQTEVTAR